MKTPRTIWLRIRSLTQRRAAKQDIDEELHFHIEQRVRENVENGMSPDEATRAARKQFGNLQKVREECRDVRRLGWLEDFAQDIRYGARLLWKNPGFAAIAVLSLAVGIAVNVALFSCINALALRTPPGVLEPDRLVHLNETCGGIPFAEFEYLRDHNSVFSAMSASVRCHEGVRLELPASASSSAQQRQEYIRVRLVSGNFFSLIGMEPARGRAFLPEEDRTPGAHPVVVLDHDFWTKHFDSDPTLVGKTVLLNNTAFTVVGIAPENFPREPGNYLRPDAWVPLMMQAQLEPGLKTDMRPYTGAPRGVQLYGRLKPGGALDDAKAELGFLDDQFAHEYFDPKEHRESWAPCVETGLRFWPWRKELAMMVVGIMAIVSMVLLIACANVTNLLLARATARQREMSVRLALGAGRARLVRQLLTESLIIACLGGLLGLLCGSWIGDVVWSKLLANILPFGWTAPFHAIFDWRIFGYALALALATGGIFGLAPAFEATRSSVNAGLKQESVLGGQRVSRSRLRNFLVVSQIAVSLTFLIVTSLLARRVQTGIKRNFAFETAHVMMLDFSRPSVRPQDFRLQAIERIKTLAGVKSVALGRVWYARPTGSASILVDGQPPQKTAPITQCVVSPGFFETLSLPFVRGRNFTEDEAKSGTPVVVVSESFAKQFWPGQEAIGHELRIGLTNSDAKVIGVVKDGVREIRSQYELTPYAGDLYSPLSPASTDDSEIWVRTEGNPYRLMPALSKEVKWLDNSVELSGRGLKDLANAWVRPTLLLATTIASLSLLALGLAAVGVYGVVAYAVAQRTQELGIRMALGAQRRSILGLVIWEGMRLVAAGIAVGLIGSAWLSFILRSVLYGLSPFDPITFIGVSLFLAAAALLACYLPARRATGIDPMKALRYE